MVKPSAAASQLLRLPASYCACAQTISDMVEAITLLMGSICTGMGTCHMGMQILSKCNQHIKVVHKFAIDTSLDCIKMIQQNFGKSIEFIFHSCVSALDLRVLPYVDLLAAGFPCQPWSAANRKRKGVADPRANVIIHIL